MPDYFYKLVLASLLALLGCGDAPAPIVKPTEPNVIVPAYGIKSVHIDMPIEELGPEWEKETRSGPAYYFLKRPRGISARQDIKGKNVLDQVHFRFHEDGYQPFQGRTNKGITAESTIEEVIKAHGQPDSISAPAVFRFQRGNPNSTAVSLYYLTKGISFFFDKDVLQFISVNKPRPDFDKGFWEDMGEVWKYRQIQPDKPSKAK